MDIIIFITALVLVVSLYDYFSSKSWQQVTSSTRNEVVFDERNKEYGAYQIRNNYDRNLILIILGLAVTIALAYGAYLFIKSLPEEEVEAPPIDMTLFTIEAPPLDEEVPPPPMEEEPIQMEKTVEFLPPVVTDDVVDTPPPTQDDMADTKASTVTNDTESESFVPTPVATPKVVEKQPDVIETFVEEEAEFPGGHKGMMEFLQRNMKYPEIAIQAGIEGRVSVRFVVEKDGTIGNVNVQKGVPGCPECDKEAVRVIKMMPKWRPGKNGGKAVRSYYSMPVVFKLR
jgi:protein TonB